MTRLLLGHNHLLTNARFNHQSWTAFSSSLPLSLTSGGPTSIIWGKKICCYSHKEATSTDCAHEIGLLVSGVCTLCTAASLAEFLSAYPTAAGQYRWVAVSWDDYKIVLSWFTAWANVTAWDFKLERWQVFLVYIGFCLVAFLVNTVWNSIISALNKVALIWSLCGFFIISITVLACAAPNYNSARQVSVDMILLWPDGLAWLLGLLQGGLCLIGVIPEPSTEGPVIMIACVAIGIATSLIFIIVLLFVSPDIDIIINSGAGPLLQILFDATNSEPGSICLLLFPIGCLLLGVIAIMTTCSRMIHALARDSGLPFSSLWTKVHSGLGTPLNALALSAFAVICCGCIFLGSSSGFNALSSATVICFDISYCVPILVHCLRGRKLLPARSWSLHPVIGWTANLISIAYILLTTVLFLFPPSRSVTGSTMNYAIAAVGVFMLISSFYFIRGHKCFMQSHVIAGMECTVPRALIEPTKLEA
ncbi:unnamed protein product [Penicillium salamii]|nr:unnamed protein product [Penicillium salamii]